MALRWHGLMVDAGDPARLGRWWAQVLGYEVMYEHDGMVAIAADGQTYPGMVFVPADEAKAGRNRLHVDLDCDDQQADVERLLDMGARQIDIGQGGVPWIVLADPEGNEFCVLPPRPLH